MSQKKNEKTSSKFFNDTYEANVFKDRLVRDDNIKHHRALKLAPTLLPDEQLHVRGVANIMSQLQCDAILRHPKFPIRMVMNDIVGARAAYLMSCGDYDQHYLEAICSTLKKGDKVIDLGAGLGISTVLAAKESEQSVFAVEPNVRLHTVLAKNMDLNKVNFTLIQGCIAAGEKHGETDFYLTHEPWSSSIFMQNEEDIQREKVAIVDLESLVKEHKANTLLVSVQGAEIGFFDSVKLDGINKVVINICTPIIGETATTYVINAFLKQGFELSGLKGWTFIFTK